MKLRQNPKMIFCSSRAKLHQMIFLNKLMLRIAVRSNKIGGSFIDVIAQNSNDTDVLDASRKLLNFFGASVIAKQFTSIVNNAKKSSTYQTVNLGEHTFYVIYSDGNLHFSETEGETHFN
ncbi:hypothetical protein [Psychrobacillus antarcticus]|uniref:hypothetical protein n=1 Tax=Psychrobacillus antarcticus TaxID=2879115 RepID=UPI002407AFFC|nr:hypothetical protein [Psychrobacillus antarcticus]